MPSPVIPRARSVPEITVSPSKRPARSTRSTGSSLPWRKRLFTAPGVFRPKPNKNPDLTVQRLREFDRRNNETSPYYKGLTDFSLVINREKLSGTSPSRESHAPSSTTQLSSRTSLFIEYWRSSCFKHDHHHYDDCDKQYPIAKRSSSSKIVEGRDQVTVSRSRIKTKTKTTSDSNKKKVTFTPLSQSSEAVAVTDSVIEKPLGERIYQSPPPPPPEEEKDSPPPDVEIPAVTLQQAQDESQLGVLPLADMVEVETTSASLSESERKYVWADKYRPYWPHEFICNKGTALRLQSMVRNWRNRQGECGHFVFEGNPGVGKRTMILALLREAFGLERVQGRKERRRFELKGEAVSSISVDLVVSPQHVELNLSELKGYEKHVLMELITEKDHKLHSLHPCNQENCRTIILCEAEKLSIDGLTYIKWILERFKGCNKVFFCCSDASKLELIKPLVTHVQLLEPSNDEIVKVLEFIARKEGINLPRQLANKMASDSKNNLRQAVRSFEATWHSGGILMEDQDIKTGWEDKIASIAKSVLEEQSPKQLYKIRGELQNLIEHNVSPEFIFQNLKQELKRILPEHLKTKFNNLFDDCQKSCAIKRYFSSPEREELGKRLNDQKKNVQQFMRIEEFVARFMSWYKALMIKNKDVV